MTVRKGFATLNDNPLRITGDIAKKEVPSGFEPLCKVLQTSA